MNVPSFMEPPNGARGSLLRAVVVERVDGEDARALDVHGDGAQGGPHVFRQRRRLMALQDVAISTPNAAPQTGAVGAISAGGSKYQSTTMSFSTHGTYEQFKSFLRDMEASLRIVDLVSLTLSPSIDTSGQVAAPGAKPSYSYAMTFRTYWLR